MNDATKMPLTSMDVAEEKRSELKGCLGRAFPEVFAEGVIDFDQLKRVLGQWVEPGKERFGLNWPGKADCMKVIQQPSAAALKVLREDSVDFDETQNAYIEGDNLEVLKLLQKAYFGKIKMIYIDPPYNTGKEFIYPDKYAESLDTYLAYSGQIDSDGRKFSTNSELSGRFHTQWLNMMFSRLYLARNLLANDGYICISIGEDEITNLRSLCNEVFGEENFVNCVSVLAKVSAGASGGGEDKKLKKNIEYIAHAHLLEQFGPGLGRPRVDTLKGSTHANMKELRFDTDDGVWRVAFAFDPRRKAILLVCGDKSGGHERRFYQRLIRVADERFDQHLERLKEQAESTRKEKDKSGKKKKRKRVRKRR